MIGVSRDGGTMFATAGKRGAREMHDWQDRLQNVGIDIPELEAYEAGVARTKDADKAIDKLVDELLAARSWEGVLAYIDMACVIEDIDHVDGAERSRMTELLRHAKALERMLGES